MSTHSLLNDQENIYIKFELSSHWHPLLFFMFKCLTSTRMAPHILISLIPWCLCMQIPVKCIQFTYPQRLYNFSWVYFLTLYFDTLFCWFANESGKSCKWIKWKCENRQFVTTYLQMQLLPLPHAEMLCNLNEVPKLY